MPSAQAAGSDSAWDSGPERENLGEEALQSSASLEGLLELGCKDLVEVMELLKLQSICAGSELLALARGGLSSLRDLPYN